MEDKMAMKEWMEAGDKHVMGTYKRFPVVLTRGAGMSVWDTDGREYLDFAGGLAVCGLGHSHPRVAAAITAQVQTLMHVSNLYHIEAQIRYARVLTENSFADKVFFCNSGAEANEAAIKLARKYGHSRLGGKYELITMLNSFHGRTLATITATGQEKFRKGFAPLPEGFKYVPFNDIEALEEAVTDKTCGVLLEPIQAEGGVFVPDEGYLRAVRELCDRKGLLLIFDEVQVGMGRTGTLFTYEQSGIAPDIMTLAKSMANGFPVGAMLATDKVASAFEPGDHACTFGGNPLAMAAALATMDVMLSDGILANCRKVGAYFMAELAKRKAKYGKIRDVRGKGLIIGVEMEEEVAGTVNKCLDKGFLVASAGPHVLRFLPPLIVSEVHVDRLLFVLDSIWGGK
jgi:acetylornithine/N-succinyldiaminopimelate aminotransferase